MRSIILASILVTMANPSALAQNWTQVPVLTGTIEGRPDPLSFYLRPGNSTRENAFNLTGNEFINVHCLNRPDGTPDPAIGQSCPPGFTQGVLRIPVAAFATQQGMAMAINELRDDTYAASAVAMTLDSLRPADGDRYRLGFNAAAFESQTAVGANFTYIRRNLDFSAGFATSESQQAFRAGVGFSW